MLIAVLQFCIGWLLFSYIYFLERYYQFSIRWLVSKLYFSDVSNISIAMQTVGV